MDIIPIARTKRSSCDHCGNITAVCDYWYINISLEKMVRLDLWLPKNRGFICEKCAQKILEEAMERVLVAALERK